MQKVNQRTMATISYPVARASKDNSGLKPVYGTALHGSPRRESNQKSGLKNSARFAASKKIDIQLD